MIRFEMDIGWINKIMAFLFGGKEAGIGVFTYK